MKTFEDFSSLKIKVVERAGEKLVDVLHKSDPWDKSRCNRNDCNFCNSKEEKLWGSCKIRNIVYENECLTCLGERDINIEDEKNSKRRGEEEKPEEVVSNNNKNKKRKSYERGEEVLEESKVKSKKVYKYIGESSRSGYERSKEHWDDFENLNPRSHILKHYLDKHQDIPMNKLNMRMKILKKYKSPFERQIGESVHINHNLETETILLNSKNEYNRCSIPRLALSGVKEDEIDEYENEQLEKEIKRKISMLKERLRMEGSNQPKGKRR